MHLRPAAKFPSLNVFVVVGFKGKYLKEDHVTALLLPSREQNIIVTMNERTRVKENVQNAFVRRQKEERK